MACVVTRMLERGSAKEERSSVICSRAWLLAALLAVVPACSYDFDSAFSGAREDAGSMPDASAGGIGGSAGAAGSGTGGNPSTGGTAGKDAATDAAEDVSSEAAAEEAGLDAAKEAEAAAPVVSPVKQVLHGTAQLPALSSKVEVTLPPVDPNRSFLVLGTRFDGGSPANSMISGSLSGPSTLTFERVGGGGAVPLDVPIAWHVAEFASGVRVQRGSVVFANNTSTVVNLPMAVDRSKSFPLITFRNTGLFYGSDDLVKAEWLTDSQLQLSRPIGNTALVAQWQVVTFEGCDVLSGSVSLAAGEGSAVVDAAGVDPARTWLLLNYGFTHGATEQPTANTLVRGSVSSPGKVAFFREGLAGSVAGTWYAVVFDNGTTVRSEETKLAPSESTVITNPLGIDISRSIAVSSGMWERSGTTPFLGTKPGMATFTFELMPPSLVSISRGTTGEFSTASWSAIEFAK